MGPFEDKYNVNENETIFVTLKLEPGDPIPTSEQIEWIKNGSKDMSVFPRSATLTPFQLQTFNFDQVQVVHERREQHDHDGTEGVQG